jgi:hypothetical protein
MKRMNAHEMQVLFLLQTRSVTTLPTLQESRPEIPRFKKRKKGTQIEDDLLVPMLLLAQSDETIELSGT